MYVLGLQVSKSSVACFIHEQCMYLSASSVSRQPDPHRQGQPTDANHANSLSQVTIIQTDPFGPHLFSAYNSKRGKILGKLQIIAGIVSVLAGFAGIALDTMTRNSSTHATIAFICRIGAGLWCGIFVSIPWKQYIRILACDSCKV